MRETEKPKLDAKALEAAIKAYDDARHKDQSSSDDMAEAIRAYLAALPPATEAWGLRNPDGTVATIADISERGIQDFAAADQTPVQVEIREVRQS